MSFVISSDFGCLPSEWESQKITKDNSFKDYKSFVIPSGFGCLLSRVALAQLAQHSKLILKLLPFSLKLLSVMAVIRLEDEVDSIEKTLTVALFNSTGNNATSKSISTIDSLASSTWEQVAPEKTLITPVQCKSLWRQFKNETEYTVTQAISAQKANRRNNNWLPPPWAMLALVVLGFNEFMTLLRNPLWLGVLFVGYLVSKALWLQLNISEEFCNGALPGLLSLTTKFLPTVMNLLRKLAEEGQAPPTNINNQNSMNSTAQSEVTTNGESSSSSSTGSSHAKNVHIDTST